MVSLHSGGRSHNNLPDFSATYNGKPSMLPHDSSYAETLGSPIISFYEKLMLNTHYECMSTFVSIKKRIMYRSLIEVFQRFRFCSDEDSGVSLISDSNLVPIITYNRVYETQTILEYRIVSSGLPLPRPQPVVSTSSSTCMDRPWCPLNRIRDYCTSPVFSESLKRSACAKSCGFCK
ncbi:unnamed protein product [Heligmosomoides polygyrus]|uniref:ShKT domain-containing protein n=1 Tax=Heligmosomoides polygyrus TaxID=6339 RepID=A0A183GUT5_HELPZ|nr:unnamed protein product [Heligmosomoides polygyrus]